MQKKWNNANTMCYMMYYLKWLEMTNSRWQMLQVNAFIGYLRMTCLIWHAVSNDANAAENLLKRNIRHLVCNEDVTFTVLS